MTDRYQPNNAGLREILTSPEVRACLTAVAEQGKGFAEALAQDFRVTGDYAASFEISQETLLWRRGRRAAVRLENLSDHAAAVEWGNQHDENPHRTLGRTLDALRTL